MSKVYPLIGLKGIRDRRLKNSINNRLAKKKQLEQTQQECIKKKQELEDYKVWRHKEEERRYQELFRQQHSLEQIQKFNSGIKNLYVKEFEIEEEVKKAEVAITKAKEVYENAVQEEQTSRKKLQKLESHQEIWQAEQRKYEERMEDQELEDFMPRSSALE